MMMDNEKMMLELSQDADYQDWLDENWENSLDDELGFDPYEGCYTYDC